MILRVCLSVWRVAVRGFLSIECSDGIARDIDIRDFWTAENCLDLGSYCMEFVARGNLTGVFRRNCPGVNVLESCSLRIIAGLIDVYSLSVKIVAWEFYPETYSLDLYGRIIRRVHAFESAFYGLQTAGEY